MQGPEVYGWKPMFKIVDNTIEITRGDSGVLALTLTSSDGSEYVVQPGDAILLTVKKSTRMREIILQKIFNDGQIKFEPQDTENLPYGEYVYDVQLTTASNDVFTVITPHKFKVLDEVTWGE